MLEAFGATDAGCVRANNEDSYLLVPDTGLYIVADGMGGAQAGEHASRMAVETVRDVIANRTTSGPTELVVACIEANRRVLQAAESDPKLEGMGTTLTAVIERGSELLVANVGDSRLYTYLDGEFKQVTEDQTWVNEVGRKLGLTEDILRTHPMRHVLTMALGVSDQLRVNTYRIKAQPGMQFLLCSDGLHGVAREEDLIAALASDQSLEAKCQQMIQAARDRGGPDNITALILRAE
jgi:protein phosphatase